MTQLYGWKVCCAVLLFCAATALIARAQVFTTLADFNGTTGSPIFASLVQGIDGDFYGTTYSGGSCLSEDCGTIFKVTPAGVMTTIYNFCTQPNCTDGSNPAVGLVLGTDGVFYGTTFLGGDLSCMPPNGCGSVFRFSPTTGSLTTMHTFELADGALPFAPLVQGVDGEFYGTTADGGNLMCAANGCGTVFKITSDGMLRVLHKFAGAPNDGANPEGVLVQATNGNFYGITPGGGSESGCNSGPCGTAFKITPSGIVTILHNFCSQDGCRDGNSPAGGLIQAGDGRFFGTTSLGGTYNGGTLFMMDVAGKLRTVYSFCSQSDCSDGDMPFGTLLQATDANLYGTTAQGGNGSGNCASEPPGCGTVFEFSAGGSLTVLHAFDSGDGQYPYPGLLQATNGIFYGTTAAGGADDHGTVYSLDAGLGAFVAFVRSAGKVGQTGGILGQGFTGTTSVMLNGVPANFTVVSNTYIKATVPPGAATGYVTVTTPTGVLTSNVPFHVIR